MLKFMGSVLIIAAGTLIGVTQNFKLKRRVGSLESFRDFLVAIRTKINFAKMDLKEIFEDNKDQFSLAIKNKISGNKINLAYINACESFFITKEDQKMALDFLNELGKTDVSQQVKNISVYLDITLEKIAEAKSIVRNKSKVNITFFTFLSFTIVVLLM